LTRHAISTLVAGTACYSVCAGLSLGRALQAQPFAFGPLAMDLAVPGLAVLTLFLLAAALPQLVPDRPIRFPLNVTIPAVYVALLGVWASLLGTMRNSVVALPEPLVAATSWGQPERWLPAIVGQIAALTLWTLASKIRARR